MSSRAQKRLAVPAHDLQRARATRVTLPGQSVHPALPQPDATSQDLQLEVATYIEALSAELRAMAKVAGLGSLAYFLEMARLEASIQVERHAGAPGEDHSTI